MGASETTIKTLRFIVHPVQVKAIINFLTPRASKNFWC